MNNKLVWFSASVTALIGCVLGVVTAEIFSPYYNSHLYQNLKSKYALIGAGLGLVIGASQESIRQIQKQEKLSQAKSEQKSNF